MNKAIQYGLMMGAAAGLLSGCSDRFSGDCDALSDRAIVLASDVADAAESRAVAVNGTALTGVQFLRKDGTGAPTDFSGVSAVVGNRATNGNITFTPTVPTYKLNNDRAYFRAYHPAGTVGGNLVTWGVDARTDILVSSVFDAGTYMAPITGPMVFRHVLAQLEVKCVADPLATTSEASVQLAWGRVTKVELLERYASVSFNTATGAVAGSGALGAVGLVGSDYHAALGATALTKAGFTAAGMLVPAATGTAPLKLRVTTEQGGVQDIAVQLQSGSTNMGFAAGLKHTVTLQFNAAEKQILVSATKVSEWALGHSAAPEVNQPPPPYVEINGVWWATGNLIADGANGCKIGAPADGGLYFQFGSLVGWSGGSSGSGVGVTNTSLSVDKAVWPLAMGATKPSFAWQNNSAAGITTLINYYFNYSDGWATSGQDIRTFNNPIAGDSGTGTLATGRYAKQGVGDPCSYYLGGTWRLPTGEEYGKMCNNQMAIDGYTWAQTGGTPSLTAAPYGGTFASSQLFFPASGLRNHSNGSFGGVTPAGLCWSSSVGTATYGLYLLFNSSWVYPQTNNNRSHGFPVRCVSSVP